MRDYFHDAAQVLHRLRDCARVTFDIGREDNPRIAAAFTNALNSCSGVSIEDSAIFGKRDCARRCLHRRPVCVGRAAFHGLNPSFAAHPLRELLAVAGPTVTVAPVALVLDVYRESPLYVAVIVCVPAVTSVEGTDVKFKLKVDDKPK